MQLNKICVHHRELAKLSGADFNVFKIVNVIYDEVKHSAFLAELLNPKGSNGCGDAFLKIFVDKNHIEGFHCETAATKTEYYIGQVTQISGGLIDIFIDDKQGNYIIIENKINAADQDNQLIRYNNIKNKTLFYLTLTGKDASQKSKINSQHNIELKCDLDYKNISYEYDILEWLELCQKEAVSMPILREGIVHYINLVKFITGKSNNKAMQKEVVDLVTDNPLNLQNAKTLVNNWKEIKTNVQWKFWEALKDALLVNGIHLDQTNNTVTEKKILECYEKEFSEKYTRFGLYSQIFKKNDIIISWGCEINQNIYFGFKIENGSKSANAGNPEYSEYRNIILQCDCHYNLGINDLSWIGWQYPNPRLNFLAFNEEAIFNLTNKFELKKTVEFIASRAYNDINFVQHELRK